MKKIIVRFAATFAFVGTVFSTFADDGQGTATLENNILTLSGLVTNVTAEADLGASVTQVVMTAEGGVAFGATLTAAKNYVVNGTGVVSVAEGKRFTVTVPRLSTIGHTLVKDGSGTLYFAGDASAVGNVAMPTRWVVKEGELRIRPGGSFWGGHSNTPNLAVELREGTTFYQEQLDADGTHNPMGLLEMTGAQFNQFVQFAQEQPNAATSKAIARVTGNEDALAGRSISASTTDHVRGVFSWGGRHPGAERRYGETCHGKA